MNNQKAQSLVELSTFGAVLLFCLAMLINYGMKANYQQNLQMQVFRKAMKAAYYKTGPASGISISRIEDKGIPDPQDPWGFPERQPIAASASATWDTNLQALYIDDYEEPTQESDLPRQIIEINDTLGLKEVDLTDAGIDNIGRDQGAFKTADYDDSGCSGSIMMVLENPPEIRALLHEEYREVVIDCSEIRVLDRDREEDESDKLYPYVKIDGLKHKVSAADIDGDGEEETIIAVKGTLSECKDNGYCGGVSSFAYIDYQQGDIDSQYAAIAPWEEKSLDEQQGLLSDSRVVRIGNNTMIKTDTPTHLATTTAVGSTQTTTHYIRLREDGSLSRPYATTFSPAYGPFRLSRPEDVDADNWRPSK